MKNLIKRLIRLTPYRVTRACDANRFQAIDETLSSLSSRGFAPKIIFDGGANVGDFARLARRIFGSQPQIHLFEPQPACQPILQMLATKPRFQLHAAALGSSNEKSLDFIIEPASYRLAPVSLRRVLVIPKSRSR